uniref:NADH dehydrogenase subunit 6 n=1 Tax=Marshallagia marshalli TaxID=106947 RepID=A0A343QXG5_9BILA|nr:NADH dehydrogenase subunit 6 [Marshallagia marshalli]ATV81508.1 NADH dehydrogenase subunit 6 [Marshallagia marshalli]
MLSCLLLISLLSSLMSYINMDPMKSSFFLILSMLTLVPVMSFGINVWFSYFISMLFLSGIFVILVYFSSLSSFGKSSVSLVMFTLLLTVCNVWLLFVMLNKSLNLNVIYYKLFWGYLVFVVLILLFFMNFTSYFLSFSGALRKV